MNSPTIEQAIEALRKLPARRQQELAGYIYDLAADQRGPEEIAPADIEAVNEGLGQARQRRFASPERVAAALGLKHE